MEKTLVLSKLPKTWIFDLDGTLLDTFGYKTAGVDTVLFGVNDDFDNIPA